MIDAFGLQRIEESRNEIAATETAKVRVVVDTRNQESHDQQHRHVRHRVAARHPTAAAMAIREDGADQAGNGRRRSDGELAAAQDEDRWKEFTSDGTQRKPGDAADDINEHLSL